MKWTSDFVWELGCTRNLFLSYLLSFSLLFLPALCIIFAFYRLFSYVVHKWHIPISKFESHLVYIDTKENGLNQGQNINLFLALGIQVWPKFFPFICFSVGLGNLIQCWEDRLMGLDFREKVNFCIVDYPREAQYDGEFTE